VCVCVYIYIHTSYICVYTFTCSHICVSRFDESKSSKRPGFANTAQCSMTLNCVYYNTITARSLSKSLPSRCDVFRPKSNTPCRWPQYVWLFHYYYCWSMNNSRDYCENRVFPIFGITYSGWLENIFMNLIFFFKLYLQFWILLKNILVYWIVSLICLILSFISLSMFLEKCNKLNLT